MGFLVVSLLVGATVRLYRHNLPEVELAEVDPVFIEKFKARSDSLNDGTLVGDGVGQGGASGASRVVAFPVNVNTATGVELQAIPKIGPVLAQKIITHRDENGRFVTVDDLLDVKGIGKRTLERIGPYVAIK